MNFVISSTSSPILISKEVLTLLLFSYMQGIASSLVRFVFPQFNERQSSFRVRLRKALHATTAALPWRSNYLFFVTASHISLLAYFKSCNFQFNFTCSRCAICAIFNLVIAIFIHLALGKRPFLSSALCVFILSSISSQVTSTSS